MKKAKIFLTAVGLLAVVGGAFALKTNMRNGTLRCAISPQTNPAACLILAKTTGTLNEFLYCTSSSTSKCTIYTHVVRDN